MHPQLLPIGIYDELSSPSAGSIAQTANTASTAAWVSSFCVAFVIVLGLSIYMPYRNAASPFISKGTCSRVSKRHDTFRAKKLRSLGVSNKPSVLHSTFCWTSIIKSPEEASRWFPTFKTAPSMPKHTTKGGIPASCLAVKTFTLAALIQRYGLEIVPSARC